MNNQNELAEKIKQYRKKKRLSQEELATRSGIHVSTIKKYECGMRNPKPAQLMKIAAALEISNSELMSYDVSDPKEAAAVFVKLHTEGLIRLHTEAGADGSYIPGSISVEQLSPEIQQAIAQALWNIQALAHAETDSETKKKEIPPKKKAADPTPKPAAKKAIKEAAQSESKKESKESKEVSTDSNIFINPSLETTAGKQTAQKAAALPPKAEKPAVKDTDVKPSAVKQESKPATAEKTPAAEAVPKAEEPAPKKEASPAPEILSGQPGTGAVILEHMELFRFKFNSTTKFNGQDCLTYEWSYNKQGGVAIIRRSPEGVIESTSSLTCKRNKGGFRQPLNVKKDASLQGVFEKMLAARRVVKK